MHRNKIHISCALALLPVLACGPKPDTAETTSPESASTSPEGEKAREAAEKRARLQALPPLPGIEDPRPVEFPEPTIVTLKNGLEVVVVEDHEIPLVSATLYVRAGDIYADESSPVLATMVASLLSEGTKKKKKAKIDETIDMTGGSLSSSSTEELASIRASVLRRDLGTAFALMAEEATAPAFPEDAIKKLKDQLIQATAAAKVNPQALAQTLAGRVIYGEKSAYGRSFPSTDQIESVTREQIEEFFKKHYTAKNATLVVAGDVDPKAIEKLATKHFGSMPAGEQLARPQVDETPALDKPVVHIVNRRASAQAYIAAVFPAPKIGEEGFLEMQVLRNVLAGGTMSTRLNFVLREQLGLTYGAAAQYSYGFDGGSFGAGGGTKNKTGGEFAQALLPLVTDLGQEPLPDNELRRVKRFVSGRFALEAEGAGTVAQKTMTARLYDLPDDYWATYRSNVAEITAPALQEVAGQYLAPNRAQIIAVGKRKKLEKQLAGLGEVRVYNTDLERVE